MKQHPKPEEAIPYQIQVQGRLDEAWSDWLESITITYDSGVTTLRGPVVDQAVLRGILNRIWDLNLTLLSVTRGGAQ